MAVIFSENSRSIISGSKVMMGGPYVAPSIPSDPNFANVSLLLHGDGTNGSTTIIDSSPSPKTVTAFGNAQISTAQSKFGGSSIAFDGSGDSLSATSSDFAFGTGDFTQEGWVRLASTNDRTIWGYGSSNANGVALFADSANQRRVYVDSAPVIIISGNFPVNTWFHAAVVRSSGTITLYQDGQSIGSVSNASNITGTQFQVGRSLFNDFSGYIDELRITKGIARYTANFTPPTAPFPDI